MTLFAIPIPTVGGIIQQHVGVVAAVTTLESFATGVKLDLNFSQDATVPISMRVGDGVNDVSATIPIGGRYATADASAFSWPDGADIEMEVTAGSGLGYVSGTLYVNTNLSATVLGAGWVTLGDVKFALGLGTTDAVEDVFLNRMIDLVTERGRLYTGRVLNRASWVETFYYPDAVTLREFPVESIDAVDRDGTTLTPANIKANLERGRVWQDISPARDWAGTNTLTVTYTAGYDPIPVGVQEWCFQAIAKRWAAYQSDGAGLEVSMTPRKIVYPDAGSVDFGDAGSLSASFDSVLGVPMSALDPYRDLSHGMSSEYSAWVVAP